MSFIITAGSATDVGMVRDGNEDSMLVRPPLYIVADGMGGHLGGEVASALAVEILAAQVDRRGTSALADGVREANIAIYERQNLDASLHGMGTTLTAAVIEEGSLHLAHVGDSRAYLIRGDEFRMLTSDHTLVGELMRAKRLTEAEARVHPQRSMLTRALGIDAAVDIDEQTLTLRHGDRIVLCSDGLNALLEDEQIEPVARAGAPTEAARALVAAANAAGGIDNTTVIVLDVSSGEVPAGAPAGFATMLPPVTLSELKAPSTSTTATLPRARGVPTDASGDAATDVASASAPTARALEDIPWWRSRIVIVSGLILLVTMAGIPVYAFSHSYVGVHDGKVALFHGLPGSFFGIPLHTLRESSDLDAAAAEGVGGVLSAGLETGIPVADDHAGLALIDALREQVVRAADLAAPQPSPTPAIPSPSPVSPTPTASPSTATETPSGTAPTPTTEASPSPGTP